MRYLKSVLGVAAILMAFAGAFAFSDSNKVADAKPAVVNEYFELIPNGNKLNRMHWVLSDYDPACPEEVTDEPCRIVAEASGSNPSTASFSDILSETDDFTEEYAGKVYYKP